MVDQYELGFSAVSALGKEFSASDPKSMNEADTRFRFINDIITKCLGWAPEDVKCERHHEGEYSDYELSKIRRLVVIEAKKAGNYFELPLGVKKIHCPLRTITRDNPGMGEAIAQVAQYCQTRGIGIGVVCNGWQLVAFIAGRNDSVPPLEGNALVVDSLETFSAHYREVWNCLSPTGVTSGYLYRTLVGDMEKRLPEKLSASISGYPGIRNRNPFQTDMEIISDLVLEDVVRDAEVEKEFLKECYCSSGALSRYSMVSKTILTSRYAFLFDANDEKALLAPVANKKGSSRDFNEVLASSVSKRPILLLGDVGAGKSIFIKQLVEIQAESILSKAVVLQIDLGYRAILALDIRKAILDIIYAQLVDEHGLNIEDDSFVRHCYFKELESFKRSARVKPLYESNAQRAVELEVEFLTEKLNDKSKHIGSALEHIAKSQRKQIIVFVDNCDQRNQEDQEAAFLIAQEMAANWPALVFLSLRPETFHNAKKETGALSGYHTKAFLIHPPRTDEVLNKRLSFAQRIARGEYRIRGVDIKASFSKLDSLIEAFRESLERTRGIQETLTNIANGNTRKSIELVKKFFGSGHVDTEKIVRLMDDEGRYVIPIHEFLRAIIFGDSSFYNPGTSDVVNCFDVRSYDEREHFVVPILLDYLWAQSSNARQDGFVGITELYAYLQNLGYRADQVDSAIVFAYSKGLLETSLKGSFVDLHDGSRKLRITSSGAYHVGDILKRFVYYDAIVVDVPFFDDGIRQKMVSVGDIDARLLRAAYFRSYLDSVWARGDFNKAHFNWPQWSSEWKADMDRADHRVHRTR